MTSQAKLIESLKGLARLLTIPEHPERWEEFDYADEDWVSYFNLANVFWLGPSLALVLKSHPHYGNQSKEFVTYCEDLAAVGVERNLRHRECLVELTGWLNSKGIQPLLLKGSAELFDGADDPVGRRWMMDLDVVLPVDEVKRAWGELQSDFAYTPLKGTDLKWQSSIWHHAPVLESPSGVTVELHRYLLSSAIDLPLDWAEVVSQEVGGTKATSLKPTLKLIQAIAHDQICHRHYKEGVMYLRYHFNVYLLLTRYSDEIEWDHVEEFFQNRKDVLDAALGVQVELFGLQLPVVVDQTSFRSYLDRSVTNMNLGEPTVSFLFQKIVADYYRRIPTAHQTSVSYAAYILKRTLQLPLKLTKLHKVYTDVNRRVSRHRIS